uniref:Uncharacterized protein n=1 Tax=Rhizophora mucronata TaxID=61149 RepID=A0A2P2MWC6_RHIMU
MFFFRIQDREKRSSKQRCLC